MIKTLLKTEPQSGVAIWDKILQKTRRQRQKQKFAFVMLAQFCTLATFFIIETILNSYPGPRIHSPSEKDPQHGGG